MLKITYTPKDEALAEQMLADLRRANYQVEDIRANGVAQTAQDVLIVVLSPEANDDANVQNTIITALDNGQHIIPVFAAPAELPRLIDHLGGLDFSETYDFDGLRAKVEEALARDARLPLRVRTPSVRRSNRSVGIVLGLLALLWFGLGLYGVGVLGIQAPQEEYDAVNTEVALTQAFLMNPELDRYGQFLPRSTEAAQNYGATLRAVPTVYRPFMAATATAYGMGTPLATNDMPTSAEETEQSP
jgi:hypothetical protein